MIDKAAANLLKYWKAALVKCSRPWTDFRAISNSYAARSTVLIPLIGYLILFNENVVKYLQLPQELGGTAVTAAGISPRLLLIYFGLCFVAAATTLYGVFCPTEVKHYGSANAYVIGDGPSIMRMTIEAICRRLDASDFHERFQRFADTYTLRTPEMIADPDNHPSIKNDLLHMYFDYMNTRHRRTRICCTILFAIGFICLAIPSLGVFLRVCRLLLASLVG